MTIEELKQEINIELELIENIVAELLSLDRDIKGKEPSLRERTAAAAFMAQFYGGIENILKRINYFNSIPLPAGNTWHIDLFKRFSNPPYNSLPLIFDETLEKSMSPFRKFRHVVYHGYGFQLDWDRMKEGIETIEDTFSRFKTKIFKYLESVS